MLACLRGAEPTGGIHRRKHDCLSDDPSTDVESVGRDGLGRPQIGNREFSELSTRGWNDKNPATLAGAQFASGA